MTLIGNAGKIIIVSILRKTEKSGGGAEFKDTFAGFHPVVNFAYFIAVIGFSMFFTHPVCLALSFVCALIYSVYIKGGKAVKFTAFFMLPVLLATALLNPVFNHQGGTILTYFPDGNPLTLESVLYGFASAAMLITVITWFTCFNEVMTSDKFIYLFGRIIPSLSLIFTMALRFVPRFRAQIKVIGDAQKCIGKNVSDGNPYQRMRHGVKILSILITWALENAIETADSMKGRGYGLPGRTAFSIFRFDRRDASALSYILCCSAVVIAGAAMGAYNFRYFPTVKGAWSGPAPLLVFASYFALGALPLAVNLKEDIIWIFIQSRT